MDIFYSIQEIELSSKYIAEAQKQLDAITSLPCTQSAQSITKNIQPAFIDRVTDLKDKVTDEVDIISTLISTVEDQKLLPETIDVYGLVGEEMEAMPEWFATAIQKQLEKHRHALNSVIKKMFRSMFSENQKQGLKKDVMNAELLIKRMVELDKNRLSNSQMIQLMALMSRFQQSRVKYVRFLNDCAKRVMQFVKENQQKAVSFSSSNKVYVEDMRSPAEWATIAVTDMRENTIPNLPAPNFYLTSNLGYQRPPLTSLGYPRMQTQNSFASQKIPTGYFHEQKIQRGLSSLGRGGTMKQEILRGAGREGYYNREPTIADTGRNFYYRQANSLSRPITSNMVAPSYPRNNLYRQFYY